MKKIYLVFVFLFLALVAKPQTTMPIPITSGMTGLQLRNSLNLMFDSIFSSFSNLDPFTVGITDRVDTLMSFYSGIINPKDYGAKGDSITDDYSAFLESLDSAAATGKPIYIPTGYYKINTALRQFSFNKDHSFVMIGLGTVTLDFSDYPDNNNFFGVRCIISDASPLITSVNKNDSSLVADATGLSIEKDDIIEIKSTDAWQTYHVKGELVRVKSVDADTIYLYEPLWNAYNSATTNIKVFSAGRATINNIKFIGPSTHVVESYPGLNVEYFRNIDIRNVSITNSYSKGLIAKECYGGVIDNCIISDAEQWAVGYGLALESCQKVTVQNCIMEGIRHGVSLVGTFPNRDIIIQNNKITMVAAYNNSAGIAVYGGEEIIMEKNIIKNGSISASCPNLIINNNFIETGVALDVDSLNSEYFIVSNNTIQNGEVNLVYHTGTVSRYRVFGNSINKPLGGIGSDFLISVSNLSSLPVTVTFEDLEISNNLLTDHTTTNDFGIYIGGDIQINRAVIENNNIYTQGRGIQITADTILDAAIKYNNIHSLSIPIDIYGEGNYNVSDNYFNALYNGVNTSLPKSFFQFNGNLILKNNVFKNKPLKGGAIIRSSVDTAYVFRNEFMGSTTSSFTDSAAISISDLLNIPITATADGLTTGLLPPCSQDINVTSASANYICCLPTTGTLSVGYVIKGRVGANGFELRPIAAQAGTVYINNVTTNVEAAIPANSTFEVICVDATHWLLKVWAADGTYSAPIPDAM